MSKKGKIILATGISTVCIITLIIISVWFFWTKSKVTIKGVPEDVVQVTEEVKFTSNIFDPSKVSHIIPLGELNGGYVESQTINGICINNKTDKAVDVYAPTDMTLEDYSYFTGGENTPNWHLGFRISKDVKLSFDHITWVPDEVRAVTPPTPNSGYVPPKKSLSFKAGDLIAKTSGTDQAHNWNIYMRDNLKTNKFANQERFEPLKERYDYVNAVCPFDYYEDSRKSIFLALMGATEAGQSKTCGTNSRDKNGSISGMWHLTKDGVMEDYQGEYATPFSIYKNSSGQVVLYEINSQRYLLGSENLTYKDPVKVITSHCYNLTKYPGERQSGYAYFKVTSDTEMQLVYSESGLCPSKFPAGKGKTYYR